MSHEYLFLFKIILIFIGLALLGIFLFLCHSIQKDNATLKMAVDNAIKSFTDKNPSSGCFIEQLNHFVYSENGFAKNSHFFCLNKLGPTPLQVLKFGGDCADKSRLLSAILRLLGVKSTLLMLYDHEDGQPTHTVVNVKYKHGWMAADPVFDIVFPKSTDKYYGAAELKSNPSLLINRLDTLVGLRGVDNKIAYYKRQTETYDWAKTINLDKNKVLKLLSKILSYLHIDPNFILRPYFMEDPKAFIALGSLTMASLFLASGMII